MWLSCQEAIIHKNTARREEKRRLKKESQETLQENSTQIIKTTVYQQLYSPYMNNIQHPVFEHGFEELDD